MVELLPGDGSGSESPYDIWRVAREGRTLVGQAPTLREAQALIVYLEHDEERDLLDREYEGPWRPIARFEILSASPAPEPEN